MANVTVKLHGAFSQFAGGARSAKVEASDIGSALAALVEQHPSLAERMRDEHGKLRDHVNIFANDDEIRYLDGERTPLRENDVVHIVPAVSGGEGLCEGQEDRPSSWRGTEADIARAAAEVKSLRHSAPPGALLQIAAFARQPDLHQGRYLSRLPFRSAPKRGAVLGDERLD